MRDRWPEVPLGEFAEVVGGGTPSTKDDSFWGGEIAWITPKDLAQHHGRFIERGERSLTRSGLASSSAKLLPERTVVVSSRAPIGYVALSGRPLATNQGCRSLIFSDDEPEFFYYVLKTSEAKLEALASGTTFREITGTAMKRVLVPRPPLREQRAIAAVLGALDDKIEQNRRTALVLERLAWAIFRAWFVDFEPVRAKAEGRTSFPSTPKGVFDALPACFVDAELGPGPVPKGWESKALASTATFLNGLALQKYPPRGDGSDLRVIKIAQLRKGVADGADWANADVPERYVIDDGDLLFSWSGTLDARLWFGGKGALNQHLFKVTSTRYSPWFCLLWIRHNLPGFRAIAASKATTMGHIKRVHLQEARVVVPTADVLRAADRDIGALYDVYAELMVESRRLASIRDLLLPHLLSGEIRVASIEGRDEP